MSSSRRRLALALLVGVAAPACTDVPLIREPKKEVRVFDNKLAVDGEICTSDPSDLVFPLKVLFVIDTSQSMNVNDPADATEPDPTKRTQRSTAMREVISRFIDLGVQFAPSYCSTGISGCDPDIANIGACQACNTALGVTSTMCVGPDCCTTPPCRGKPACPAAGSFNGTCLKLCDTQMAGCGPGESTCPDCPAQKGDRCIPVTSGHRYGVCAKTLDPGVEFAIVRFGAAKDTITRDKNGNPGFTSDPSELVTALPRVNFGSSVTDYEGALSNAYRVLSEDMARMQKENAAAINRSKYVVIFVTDGQPDPRINDQDDWDSLPNSLAADLLGPGGDPNSITQYNVPTRILRRVKEIVDLKSIYRVGEITLHTAFLAGQQPAWLQEQATSILKQMSDIGKGTFRNFQNGEKLNFLKVDFSTLKRVFRLKNFIVTNLNGRPRDGTTVRDSDGDSIPDDEERRYGTAVAKLDTDNDGFSDTLEQFFAKSGWDPLDPADADCSLAANDADGDGKLDDSDGDGLYDCEERFLGTNKDLFDTDADGIPDNIEVRFGTNPVAKDTEDDLDFDGMPNGDEIRLHTDPRTDDAANRSRTSYRYAMKRIGTGLETVGIQCKADTDCPTQQQCVNDYCRCDATAPADDFKVCSTNTACTNDDECKYAGEKCDVNSKTCLGKYTCAAVQALGDTTDNNQKSCQRQKNITCYQYKVENISLVSPQPSPTETERGWNNVYLYFGEVPFDNPGDYGNYSVACVRARFLNDTGAKEPAAGTVTVPKTAWHDPRTFNPKTDCVCPDGTVGSCP
ncbi:MAG: hypothetical protein KC503_36330 [Myxococcales bacterium]|nr:hypothetical protein [Myxococcales bacterium]